MVNNRLKTAARLLVILAVMISCKPFMSSQTAVPAYTGVAVTAEECDDSQNLPDGVSAGVASATIVDRLSAPASGVIVEGPASLMRRALPSAAVNSNVADQNTDDATEEEDAERTVRTKSGKMVGFRVQVYADNNVRSAKVEARQRERAIGEAFPAYSTYVSYASPYWRLRVGDFPTQYDAEKAASEIRKTFPRYAKEVRVVRDRINAR